MKTESVPGLIRKLSSFMDFSVIENAALVSMISQARPVPANTDLLLEGEKGNTAYIVSEGWAYCYKDLEDGNRQIINFRLPGDIMGLRSLMLRTSDHSFSTLTDCRLASVRRDDWSTLFRDHGRIATAILWSVARDEALIVDHLVSLGRRSADQRTARLLCEIGHRLEEIGMLKGKGFKVPVSQAMLADALGLSVVHLNRTLRKLREAGLARMLAPGVHVPDLARLVEHANYDGGAIGE